MSLKHCHNCKSDFIGIFPCPSCGWKPTSKEFEVSFKIDKWNFSVPLEMVEKMLSKGEGFRFIRTLDGKLHDIEQIEGHQEFDRDNVRILQLAWLFKNRKIDYAFMDEKKRMLALQISQEMRK